MKLGLDLKLHDQFERLMALSTSSSYNSESGLQSVTLTMLLLGIQNWLVVNYLYWYASNWFFSLGSEVMCKFPLPGKRCAIMTIQITNPILVDPYAGTLPKKKQDVLWYRQKQIFLWALMSDNAEKTRGGDPGQVHQNQMEKWCDELHDVCKKTVPQQWQIDIKTWFEY